MKLRSTPKPLCKAFITYLTKTRVREPLNVLSKEDMEPPTLLEVEQSETSIGSAINEYIADQQEQRSYA